MTILIIGSVLLGAILGRFFKVLVLAPACALVLAVVLVKSADREHGLLRPLLEFAVLITSLQIGYVFGLVSGFFFFSGYLLLEIPGALLVEHWSALLAEALLEVQAFAFPAQQGSAR